MRVATNEEGRLLIKRLKRYWVGENPPGEAAAATEDARGGEEARWSPQTRAEAPWHRLTLAAVLALSAFLSLYGLTSEGYGNPYYAATVKNMLTSPYNFFFVSYDAGFVTVDKPPLGFWIQAASAWLFGFHGWSVLIPQALAGVLSVGLIYHLVRRSFGPVAGLLAALTMALTPISVATSRSNNLEGLLVLAVLLAAWAFMLAAETGRLRWLLAGALVLGLGFNVKMLQAFLVLPALYLTYLVAAPVGRRRRVVHLGLATGVLLTIALSWVAVVDLTPADQRPYVGSSYNNSATDLMVGWNGLRRLTGEDADIGTPGPLRLLNQQLAEQIGWLLPLAVVGLAAAGWQRRLRLPLDQRHQALVLWGTWFASQVAFFSIAGDFDPHYLAMLAPAVAALVGIGVVALWHDYRGPGNWRGWLLPLTLVGTAGLQVRILGAYPDWSHWLVPAVGILCLAAAAGLVTARLIPRLKARGYQRTAVSVGVLSLLLAPAIWAASTVWYGAETRTPIAGPEARHEVEPGGFGSEADPLVDHLRANQDDAGYLVAIENSRIANPIILNTGEPVISYGGFSGSDPVLDAEKVADLVDEGAVRFFLMQEDEHDTESTSWIEDNCEQVQQEWWRSNSKRPEGVRGKDVLLYDCGAS